MYVIGISSGIKHGHHDGAAVLLRDGELIAAAEEERFTLAKHARGELPRGAIGFCLKQAGITMRDVDWICSPLDLQLQVVDMHGAFREPLIVKSITKLTPAEVAAIPPKFRP